METTGKEVVLHDANKSTNNLCVFSTIEGFEVGQRIAKALSASNLVPSNFQGDENLGSCMIALDLAARMGINPLQLMQGLYVVHGKPSFSGQFVGGLVNASGIYKSRLKFEQMGTPGAPDFGYRVYAYDHEGDKVTGPIVTMAMAASEGWINKNPKWKSMPDLMLRYRAISFFQRTNCPEITFGIPTTEEIEDINGGVVDVPMTEITVVRPDDIDKEDSIKKPKQTKPINGKPKTDIIEEDF